MKRKSLTIALILIFNHIVFTQQDLPFVYHREKAPPSIEFRLPEQGASSTMHDPGVAMPEVTVSTNVSMPDNPIMFRTSHNIPARAHTVMTPKGYMQIWVPEEIGKSKKKFEFDRILDWFGKKTYRPDKCPTF